MREPNGAFKSDRDVNGSEYHLHWLVTPPPDKSISAVVCEQPDGKLLALADVATRHEVYSALLGELTLSALHQNDLAKRGLDPAEISKRQYRTLAKGQVRLAAALHKRFGKDVLLTVPGFFVNPKSQLSTCVLPGLLVPVRYPDSRIVALSVRPDQRRDGGGKYLWVSSTSHGGPGPGAPPHVPLGVTGPSDIVRITEGVLKADIATALSGVPTIGAAGATNWRPCVPILKALGCRTVRLAFDADAWEKPSVGRALRECFTALRAERLTVEVERWDPAAGKGIDDVLAARGSVVVLADEDAAKAVAEAAKISLTDGQAAAAGGVRTERPAIEINTERHRILAETLAVLPSDPALYCRGNVPVRIAHETKDTARLAGGVELRHATGTALVVMVAEAGLGCRLTALADFYKWEKGRSGEYTSKPAHPPAWLMRAILENGTYPGVRPLRGLAEVPFPRPDGSLVTATGYDPATAVYHAPTVALDPLPVWPDKAAAKAAAEAAAAMLLELVEQFPFASEDDKAVWLAALLTVLARPGIAGPVPGFVLVGNRAGTGKGKLVDTIGVIATGRPIPCTGYPGDDDETRKLKTALALAATPIVHLDNISEGWFYGGGAIDSALTSLEVNERILGQSKTTDRLELRCCWFLSGNNISPGKDAFRRWLPCNLATNLERPEERNDLKVPDLLAHVRERRAELVRAGLIILRAHAVADRPTGGWAALGSFEEWDRTVRGAVWYATGKDCNATRRQAADDSPERLDRLALLEAWAALPAGGQKSRGVTAGEAYQYANERIGSGEDQRPRYPELVDALMRFSKDGKLLTARAIGNLIRTIAGRNIGGLAFRKAGDYQRSALWKVCKLSPDIPNTRENRGSPPFVGESGESGESIFTQTGKFPERQNDVMMCGDMRKEKQNGLETDSQNSPDSPGEEEVTWEA
jgi:hypothetical protein